jgi:hypothetical protein
MKDIAKSVGIIGLCLIVAAMIIGGIAFEIGKVLAIFKYLFS